MTTDRQTGRILSIILTAVGILLSVLVAFQAYQISAVQDQAAVLQGQISAIPHQYVQKERYVCDIGRIEKLLTNMGLKIDRLVERRVDDQPDR